MPTVKGNFCVTEHVADPIWVTPFKVQIWTTSFKVQTWMTPEAWAFQRWGSWSWCCNGPKIEAKNPDENTKGWTPCWLLLCPGKLILQKFFKIFFLNTVGIRLLALRLPETSSYRTFCPLFRSPFSYWIKSSVTEWSDGPKMSNYHSVTGLFVR